MFNYHHRDSNISISHWDSRMGHNYVGLQFVNVMRNQIWDPVPLRKGRKVVWCKWIYWTTFATYGFRIRTKHYQWKRVSPTYLEFITTGCLHLLQRWSQSSLCWSLLNLMKLWKHGMNACFYVNCKSPPLFGQK